MDCEALSAPKACRDLVDLLVTPAFVAHKVSKALKVHGVLPVTKVTADLKGSKVQPDPEASKEGPEASGIGDRLVWKRLTQTPHPKITC